METCPGCGLSRPGIDGPLDPYGGASASCWAAFQELLVGDYTTWRPLRHRLTVDAYMSQHPGFATVGGRRSVLTHLVGLQLALEDQLPPASIGPILGCVFPDKSDRDVPAPLPIPRLDTVNIDSVIGARTPEAHDERVTAWATAVWQAWAPHHERVRALTQAAIARAG
jgi:hypothetical protein